MESISYEYLNESTIGEHLKCDFCRRPLRNPVLTSCQHKFCAKCIEEPLETHRACLKCRQTTESVTKIVDSDLLDELNHLLVKCSACDKTNLQRESFPEHEENHRLKQLCRKQKEKILQLENQLALSRKYAEISKTPLDNERNQWKIAAPSDNYLCIHDQRGVGGKLVCDIESKYNHRYSNVTEDPQRILGPMEDYKAMTLVSLEEAVQPLISLVPKIERMVWTVKQRCETPANHLSSDESASIMLYSMEVEPKEHCFYRVLNHALQNEDRHMLKPWLSYLRLFITSLSKLPIMDNQVIYRGIGKDLSRQYPQGITFTWWEFLSCTQSIQTLERFLGKTGIRTLFKIECHSGKDIRQHSCFQKEDEVLLPAASQFRVISNHQESSELHIIYVQEIRPISVSDINLELQQTISDSRDRSTIDLRSRRLTDQDMRIVAEQAIIDKQCGILDLGSNRITSHGIAIIGHALARNGTIRRLYLADNQIGDDGTRHLAPNVENSSLYALGLSENGITDTGAQYLSEMLKRNRRLAVLGLENNQIGDRGVEWLADGLKCNNSLQRLLLDENRSISDGCVDALIDMLRHNRTLRKLKLEACNLSEAGKAQLREVAQRRKNFELSV